MNAAALLLVCWQLPASADFSNPSSMRTVRVEPFQDVLRSKYCQTKLGSCGRCGTVVDGRGGKCPACGAVWSTITVNGKTYRTGAGRSNTRGDWMEAIILFVFGIMGLAFVCGMIWLVQFLIEQQKQKARRSANQAYPSGDQPTQYYPPPRDPRCGY